jgi:hypothetical protein
MNEKAKHALTAAFILWLATVMCSTPSALQAGTAQATLSQENVATAVALTLTAVAGGLPTTTFTPAANPQASPQTPTFTPEFTATVTNTPPPTLTPPPVCPGPPVISSFSASPSTITVGNSTTLSWGAVSNANSIQIDGGIGVVTAPGSVAVSPSGDKTYTMTATGCGGTVTKQASINVHPPSGTCKSGYTYRLASTLDKVCVTPASKAQAAADNAAADSRKIVNVYGLDACISGYVWREAYTNDHVCVTPATRSQAAADNAAAASRWVSGAYGPHTCIAGFVWREARSGDDVCVTGATRTQAANDNAAANSRKAVTAYGLDACISGYVWRNAFSGDHVCVTSAVAAQVAADNAAAPSHTW